MAMVATATAAAISITPRVIAKYQVQRMVGNFAILPSTRLRTFSRTHVVRVAAVPLLYEFPFGEEKKNKSRLDNAAAAAFLANSFSCFYIIASLVPPLCYRSTCVLYIYNMYIDTSRRSRSKLIIVVGE